MQLINANIPLIYTPPILSETKYFKINCVEHMDNFGTNLAALTWDAESQLIATHLASIIQFLAHFPRSKVAPLLLITAIAILVMTPNWDERCETGQCQTDKTERSYACRIQSWFWFAHFLIRIIVLMMKSMRMLFGFYLSTLEIIRTTTDLKWTKENKLIRPKS